jgi:hypothetical protein
MCEGGQATNLVQKRPESCLMTVGSKHGLNLLFEGVFEPLRKDLLTPMLSERVQIETVEILWYRCSGERAVIETRRFAHNGCSPPLLVLRGTTAVRGPKASSCLDERRALMRIDCYSMSHAA